MKLKEKKLLHTTWANKRGIGREWDRKGTARYWNEHEDNNVLVGYCNECKQIVTTLSEAKWMQEQGKEAKQTRRSKKNNIHRQQRRRRHRHRPTNNVQNWIFVNNIFPAYGKNTYISNMGIDVQQPQIMYFLVLFDSTMEFTYVCFGSDRLFFCLFMFEVVATFSFCTIFHVLTRWISIFYRK